MANCADVDGVTMCYRCYATLCGTNATPTRVTHLLDGRPIIVSMPATAALATPAARELCGTVMQSFRALAELLADESTSVGDRTPAERNELRNAQILHPAPTVPKRPVAPASAQAGCNLPSCETPVSTPAVHPFLSDMRDDMNEADERAPFSCR